MKLTWIEDEGVKKSLNSAEKNVVIGRAPTRGLKVEHPTVSREHARIFYRNGELQVADLNSSNGTFVNGERMTRGSLNPGDILRLGSVDLRVEPDEPSGDTSGGKEKEETDSGFVIEETTDLAGTVISNQKHGKGDEQSATQTRQISAASRMATELTAQTKIRSRSGGVFGQDMAQQSFGKRMLFVLIALSFAAALFYGVQKLTEQVIPEGGLPPNIEEDDVGSGGK